MDRHGNSVDDGDLFLPEEDPCIACTCSNGAREGCMTVACEKPHCENFVRSSDSCCGYTCIESHVANDTLGKSRKNRHGSRKFFLKSQNILTFLKSSSLSTEGSIPIFLRKSIPGRQSGPPEARQQNVISLEGHMSRNMRFPTMWYVQPAKPHFSLRICAI